MATEEKTEARKSVLPEKEKAVPVAAEMGGKSGSDTPSGRRKSGRSWKDLQGKKPRISQLTTLPHMHKTYEQRRAEKRELDDVRALEKSMRKRDANEKRRRRLRAEENRRRREENEKKSQVVQIITNTRKLKRLSKRQMRNIRPLMDSSSLAKK